MSSRSPQPPKPRKVIKLDLASMLEDETLSGQRQLSALQSEAPGAPDLLDVLDKTNPGPQVEPSDTYPGSVLQPDPMPAPAEPGFVLPTYVRPIRLRAIESVADGLHPGEAALLGFLWSEGIPSQNEPSIRLLSLGNAAIRRLAATSNGELGRSTAKRLLKSLAEKRCIRLREAPTIRTAAVYEIYSEQRILDTWRALAWTHVYRDRRAVVIIDPKDTAGPIFKADPGFIINRDSLPEPPQSWVDWCIGRTIEPKSASVLWASATRACPDLTPEEAIYFAQRIWSQLNQSSAIKQPQKALAASLPAAVRGQAFHEYRAWKNAARANARG